MAKGKKTLSKISLQLRPGEAETLRAAAEAGGRSLESFVLSSALSRAEDILSGRVILLDEERWRAFTEALDAPTKHRPHLARLLAGEPDSC